jgi:hypothetical protein
MRNRWDLAIARLRVQRRLRLPLQSLLARLRQQDIQLIQPQGMNAPKTREVPLPDSFFFAFLLDFARGFLACLDFRILKL